MRHSASLIVDMEGISRPAFRIACELAQNSRSGLTVRFLSQKTALPQEEVEYLIDTYERLFFRDITKVKLVAEGTSAIRRIISGLENHGDVASLTRCIMSLPSYDFGRFEERIGIVCAGKKKDYVPLFLETFYHHPESVIEYVATRRFSSTAREIFDLVWQSPAGVLPMTTLRSVHNGSEYEIEQALWELFRGYALFELFRFDAQDKLERHAALLSEIRQWREEKNTHTDPISEMQPFQDEPHSIEYRELSLTKRICSLVASIAARPVRLRGDDELYKEDRHRLEEIHQISIEPSLDYCIWVAQGVNWLVRVDNELRANTVQSVISLSMLERHQIITRFLLSVRHQHHATAVFSNLLDYIKLNTWYSITHFISFAIQILNMNEPPVLRARGGHWRYMNPAVSHNIEGEIAHLLEENLFWLGIVDRAEANGYTLFRITQLAKALLIADDLTQLKDEHTESDSRIVVQPNFEIIVPLNETDPLFIVPLEQFAQRISTGQVAVYTLNRETYTRAIQEGHDGDAFIQYLMHFNRVPLPDNVLTTLDDWRGGLKHVHIRTMHIIETDDPFVAADIANRRRLKKYVSAFSSDKMLRFQGITKKKLISELEKDGFIVD